MNTPTLAEKLGNPPHLSPLLRKAWNLGLDDDDLERLAIARGCNYYSVVESLPTPAVSEEQLSSDELAIALLKPSLNTWRIRWDWPCAVGLLENPSCSSSRR